MEPCVGRLIFEAESRKYEELIEEGRGEARKPLQNNPSDQYSKLKPVVINGVEDMNKLLMAPKQRFDSSNSGNTTVLQPQQSDLTLRSAQPHAIVLESKRLSLSLKPLPENLEDLCPHQTFNQNTSKFSKMKAEYESWKDKLQIKDDPYKIQQYMKTQFF